MVEGCFSDDMVTVTTAGTSAAFETTHITCALLDLTAFSFTPTLQSPTIIPFLQMWRVAPCPSHGAVGIEVVEKDASPSVGLRGGEAEEGLLPPCSWARHSRGTWHRHRCHCPAAEMTTRAAPSASCPVVF